MAKNGIWQAWRQRGGSGGNGAAGGDINERKPSASASGGVAWRHVISASGGGGWRRKPYGVKIGESMQPAASAAASVKRHGIASGGGGVGGGGSSAPAWYGISVWRRHGGVIS
jgi:hypothetical protein